MVNLIGYAGEHFREIVRTLLVVDRHWKYNEVVSPITLNRDFRRKLSV